MCLDTMLSLEPAERVDPTKVLGFSQDDNALFVASCSRLFVVHLDSMACRQICGMDEFSVAPDSRQIYAVYPFAGFL
uniref:DUF295 domain-containing protein n=1 Tax=Oryza brachyantha TaxID=4533 RepID=J3N0V2_ORYBR